MGKWVSALAATVVLVAGWAFNQQLFSYLALPVVLFCAFLIMFVVVLLIALLGKISDDQGRIRQAFLPSTRRPGGSNMTTARSRPDAKSFR